MSHVTISDEELFGVEEVGKTLLKMGDEMESFNAAFLPPPPLPFCNPPCEEPRATMPCVDEPPRVNYERVASLMMKAALELNKATDVESVGGFFDVFDRYFKGNISLSVASLIEKATDAGSEHAGLDVFDRRLKTNISSSVASLLKRKATTEVVPATKRGKVGSDGDVKAEVFDRLYSGKTRKVDLLLRRCKERFEDAWVTLAEVEQVAEEVGYFHGATKKLKQGLLTQCRRDAVSFPPGCKPWGRSFAFWESNGVKLRLSPHFFIRDSNFYDI